ncbi:hypothetical protein [Rubellimicrobium aerolatum]|uniref:Glycosyltransferase family 2 protein n=1 Tax=Rubellimicrobium aerolatum TaxID=490979 RepID=A0ABW0S6S8_9RHOB|nr:hypothetical protein [Rubellimicrobium aerolatum]MBP1804550.1 hypothetical protein [Rubellimicrobium aerolatum]
MVRLPIAHRIERPDVRSWGNQLYILDILDRIAADPVHDRYVVLDSDCVWPRPVGAMAQAIEAHGVLTLLLDDGSEAAPINGCSGEGMAAYLRRVTGQGPDSLRYCGGEIFAATRAEILRIAGQIDAFWAPIAAGEPVEIREEAHFLSCIYAANGYRLGTANPFVRRIWTTLRVHDARPADEALTVWHLPAEKRTGFRRLFRRLAREAASGRMGLDRLGLPLYREVMGLPRRRLGKTVRDLWAKLMQKAEGRWRAGARHA